MPSPQMTFRSRLADQDTFATTLLVIAIDTYWDEDRPEWTPELHDFAAAWRRQPKWVVSRSLKSAGPNATLVADNIEETVRGLKARLDGEVSWRTAGALYRLKVEAEPRSGQVDLRLRASAIAAASSSSASRSSADSVVIVANAS